MLCPERVEEVVDEVNEGQGHRRAKGQITFTRGLLVLHSRKAL
jgi:hypothetical protein